MKTQLFTNLFWGGLLFLVSCSNNSDYQPFVPSLPPITQTGANTFGAVVDGKVFIPKTSYPSNPRSAFYHTFKKHTGVTPSAYQKQ
ncbi:hypothetical protein N9X82_03290 [Polaribacter sp.]|nr:hypothetical protein [Polaribacter sp.]